MRENRNILKQIKQRMLATSLNDKEHFTSQAKRKVQALKGLQETLALSIPKLRADLLEFDRLKDLTSNF